MIGSTATAAPEGPRRREADGGWRAVPWAEAIAGVAADLASLGTPPGAVRAAGGGAFAVYAGRRARVAASRTAAFGRALGTGRVFAWREADEAALAVAARQVLGHPVTLVPDLDRAHHVLWLGARPPAPRARTAPGGGPRPSLTVAWPRAGPAGVHLTLRPGCEVFLVLGMAGAILARGWGDAQCLRDLTRGSEEAACALAPWPPERCAIRCGLDRDELLAEALRFARAPMAVAAGEPAVFRSPHGGLLAWSLLLLHAATANALRPGGLYAPPPAPGARAPGPLGRRLRAWAGGLLPPTPAAPTPSSLFAPPDPPRALLAAGGLPTDDYGPAPAHHLDSLDFIVLLDPSPGEHHPRVRWVLPGPGQPGGRPVEDVLGDLFERFLGARAGPLPPGLNWRLAIHEAADLLQDGPRRFRDLVLPVRPAPGAQDDRARWDVAHPDGRLHLGPPPSLADLADARPDPARPLALYAGEPQVTPGARPRLRLHPSVGASDGARVTVDTASGSFDAVVALDSTLRRDVAEAAPLPGLAGALDVPDPVTEEPWRHGAPCRIFVPHPKRRSRS